MRAEMTKKHGEDRTAGGQQGLSFSLSSAWFWMQVTQVIPPELRMSTEMKRWREVSTMR